MKLIGKMDDNLVYEVDRGKYIVVNPDSGRWNAEWSWFAQLGRLCDRFTKISEDENDEKCMKIISDNAEDIVKRINRFADDEDDEFRQNFIDDQESFYEWLDEGREYDWGDGYVDEMPEE